VESVAVWTALLNERQRDVSARGAKNEIRMCAEFEGEDASHGEVLSAYAPPFLANDDSPLARILSLLNETERTLIIKRTIDNVSWEETAAAMNKPLNAVGPLFARVMTRLVRLFGAPPPMDDELVPVFSRAAVDPQKPEGRAISMLLDAAFYTVTPELQKIGLASAYDARIVVLWDTAAQATPPSDALRRHLDQCHYCTDLLRALILMQQALLYPSGIEFHLCPGSFTLADAPDLVREAFDQHLAQCLICRGERTRALDGQAPQHVRGEDDLDATAGAGKKIALVLGGLVLAGAISFGSYQYLATRRVETSPPATLLAAEQPTVAVDPRYQDLVQVVPIDDQRIMASVQPENRAAVKYAIDRFSMGQPDQAVSVTSELAAKGNDPGVRMVYAMSLYRTHWMTDGYREMLKSEAMPPRDPFRCWITFQFALMVGDRKVIDREAEHLAADPRYGASVKKTMAAVSLR
jgi:hypothetical protein